jgi:drug/metabolite transporter (DMT)-like permease
MILFFIQWLYAGKFPLKKLRELKGQYFLRVGLFFVIYMVFFYIAIGESASRNEVVVVGLLNYLWPALTFLLSVPILKKKARIPILFSGITITMVGTVITFFQLTPLGILDFFNIISGNPIPFLLILFAAVSWSIYSNTTRKYNANNEIIYLSLFLLISSAVILALMVAKGEMPDLAVVGRHWLEFSYLLFFPSTIAYLFWDISMKRGDKTLVVSISFLVPLISTFISSLYLNVSISLIFWIAVILIIGGAILCKKSIVE